MITIKGSLHGNLGDRPTNEFLGEKLAGEKVKLVLWTSTEPAFMVCGSMLEFALNNNIIWGTGFMYSASILKEKPKQICAVRGHLTRNKLIEQGIKCPEVYGDPGLLYPIFYNPKIEKRYKLGIIPHYIDKDNPIIPKLIQKDVLLIDIMKGYEAVIQQILSCEKIASSALHGLIVADAYGIPSLWIEFSNKVLGNGFKFRDYFSAVNRVDEKAMQITEKITVKNIENNFYDCKINIDLNKFYNSCPFKKDTND